MESSILHDAKLIGLTYETDKVIRLNFVTDQGASSSIILRNVIRFVATNLLDGNIVLDVLSTKFGNLDMKGAQEIVKNVFSEEFRESNPKRALASHREWERWMNQIATGELHVLKIEPSYGFEAIAICSDIIFTSTP
jgi:hypothetical protein